MNESDFEQELRALRPSEPSADLAERIAHDLQTGMPGMVNGAIVPMEADVLVPVPTAGVIPRPRAPRASWASLRVLGLGGAAAAAVFAILVFTRTPELPKAGNSSTVSPLANAAEFQPASASSELVEAEDQGFVYGDDQTAQRQFRLVYMERHSWTNPATGAVLEFEVPREDIVLMPVAMQ